MSTQTLTSADIIAIADAVVRRTLANPSILTTEEAKAYVKIESQWGFYSWCKEYGVTRSGQGRWPLHRLNAAISREARLKITDRCPEARAATR